MNGRKISTCDLHLAQAAKDGGPGKGGKVQ